ncbi:MAG: hypothetical protein LBN95_13690 [Prevotellaceae bacterium]|jgi:hypothetical protein|nr:hypothetical protein [Prevotellaceae bacterium]
MKKYSGAIMVEIELNGERKVNFPDVQNLAGKKIQAINAVLLNGNSAYSGRALATYNELYISLKKKDGTTYIIDEMPLQQIQIDNNKGINHKIDEVLSIKDCFIDNPNFQTDCSVCLIVWYELPEYTRETTVKPLYASFETKIRYQNYMRNKLPDNRTMYDSMIEEINIQVPEITPTTATGVTQSDLGSLYLTLNKGTFSILEKIPLQIFYNNDWYKRLIFDNIVFDFDNSFIEVVGTNVAINKNVLITLKYHK